jgi:hypothetical protein
MEVRAEKVTEEVGQPDCVAFISPMECHGIAATDLFVPGVDTNLPKIVSAQTTAEAAVVYIPVSTPLQRTATRRGVELTSVKVHYDLDVAGTAASLKLYKTTRNADGTIASVAEVTTTCDHTEAQLYSADEHVATLTVTTPGFLADGESLHVELSITKATTTDFSFYGAWAYFTRAL